MGRSELREHIFRILFRIEFQPKEEMEEQLALYLEELESAKNTFAQNMPQLRRRWR